jgi:dipeptidyl aminopeptidase/acylaminoacyl peptidase
LDGTGDWRVNSADSIRLAEKLYQYKVPFRLVIFEGANHGITEFPQESNKMIFNWFDRFLKKGERLPNLNLKPHGK